MGLGLGRFRGLSASPGSEEPFLLVMMLLDHLSGGVAFRPQPTLWRVSVFINIEISTCSSLSVSYHKV
jgi:hypothetical protein